MGTFVGLASEGTLVGPLGAAEGLIDLLGARVGFLEVVFMIVGNIVGLLGIEVGFLVGPVGALLGLTVGMFDGNLVGVFVEGLTVGETVVALIGATVVGLTVGERVGTFVGLKVGVRDGEDVGPNGADVGLADELEQHETVIYS